MNIKTDSIEEFYKNKWLSHLTAVFSGGILLFTSWGIKNLTIIDTSSVWSILLDILGSLVFSYILGLLVTFLIVLIRDILSIYKSIIAISLFVFLFNALFIIEYVSSERYAAKSYKKLIEKNMKYLNDEKKKEIQYDIEEIESERDSWKESHYSYDD